MTLFRSSVSRLFGVNASMGVRLSSVTAACRNIH
jgi:hypothetical protein